MSAWQRVDLTRAPPVVVNVEEWAATPPANPDALYLQVQGAGVGWTWDGTALSPPAGPSLEDARRAKLTDLASVRYQHEVGGITVLGIPVPTDRETQSIVDRICKAFDDGDIVSTVSFKSPAGFVALDASAMKAIKAHGAQHVQSCFARESVLAAEISAAPDLAALDGINLDAGWPA